MSKSEKIVPMIAHCVGRSILELPGSFVASSVTTGIFKASDQDDLDQSFDVIVQEKNLTPDKFSLEMAKRAAELRHATSDDVDVLEAEKVLRDDATLFRVKRIGDAYVSEINILTNTALVTVKMASFRGKFLAAEDRLAKFVAGIKERSGKRSSDDGKSFCLGKISIPGDFKEEKAGFLFRDGKGAHFDVNIDTYAPDASVPLLKRMSGPDSLLQVFKVNHKVYRSGERTVAGMRAQEWLGSAQTTEDEDASELQFTLETMRPLPSKTAPSIDLTFETAQPLEDGSQTKTLISKDEAIRLWDSVVASLHTANL